MSRVPNMLNLPMCFAKNVSSQKVATTAPKQFHPFSNENVSCDLVKCVPRFFVFARHVSVVRRCSRYVVHVSLGMCGCSSRVFHALGDPSPHTSMRGHPMAAHLALEPSVARRFSATLCHAFACVFERFRAFHVLVSENFFEAYKICCCLRFLVA